MARNGIWIYGQGVGSHWRAQRRDVIDRDAGSEQEVETLYTRASSDKEQMDMKCTRGALAE